MDTADFTIEESTEAALCDRIATSCHIEFSLSVRRGGGHRRYRRVEGSGRWCVSAEAPRRTVALRPRETCDAFAPVLGPAKFHGEVLYPSIYTLDYTRTYLKIASGAW